MAGLDPFRLSRTLVYLLRAAPGDGLGADHEGWFTLADVARAASRAIRRPVGVDDVTLTVTRFGGARFELVEDRVRVVAEPPSIGAPTALSCPDILYHATSRARLADVVTGGVMGGSGGLVHLVRSETHAWRVGWRTWEDPAVLYVDMARVRRDGIPVGRTRAGQFYTRSLPVRHVLNLRTGFAEQASAGGFLVEWSTGLPRIGLIRVVRRQGATWEVAKGKMEAGEAPHVAAVREVREEMGVDTTLSVSRSLGTIRYGFATPEGAPRLKTIHLFLIEPASEVVEFRPSTREGIEAVRWFSVEDAVNAIAHPSLRSCIGRLLGALDDRAHELGLGAVAK